MNKLFLSLLVLPLFLLGAGCGSGGSSTAANQASEVKKIQYNAGDLKFSSAVDLEYQTDGDGEETNHMFLLDDGKSVDNVLLFMLSVGKVSPTALADMGTEKDVALYYRSTYLASGNKDMQAVKNMFNGKEIVGEKGDVNIPGPSTVESYIVTLSDGQQIFVGMKYAKRFEAAKADAIMKEVLSSLSK